jgi:hypothetical protein
MVQRDLSYVEKDFHLEIRSRRRENKGKCKWVSVRQSHRKGVCLTEFCHTVFIVVYASHNGDSHVYAGVHKDMHVRLENHVDLGHTTYRTFLGLSADVFLSVDHYPYYRSLDLIIIKSFSALVLPPIFFQGYLPKIIGVYVCMVWFPIFLPLPLFELNIPVVYFCFVSC